MIYSGKSPSERTPVYGLAENVRSLWNVGSLFRTSDAVCARKLFLCGYTGKPPRPEISKTALGAEGSVPWEYMADPAKAVVTLKQRGVHILALETVENARSLDGADVPFPVCLVVGNEVDGVSRRLLSLADEAVALPMLGVKSSLNVAVAYGVAMYAILGKWQALQ